MKLNQVIFFKKNATPLSNVRLLWYSLMRNPGPRVPLGSPDPD